MKSSKLQARFQEESTPILDASKARLFIFIEGTDSRVKCKDAIDELCRGGRVSPEVKRYLRQVDTVETDSQVIDKLETHLASDFQSSAIVISDGFANCANTSLRAHPQPTRLGEAIRRQFGDNLLGMIGITDWWPRRIPDIDRVVPLQITPDELLRALQLTVKTLQYKTPSNKVSLTRPITVRRVKRQFELYNYFKLRHDVYSTMGYLDAKLEASPTGIEADLCDLTSIHICALEQLNNEERVVGAARLILTENEDEDLRKLSEKIAKGDPVLRRRFRPPHPQLQLPVWQSQEVSSRIAHMYQSEEKHGEISRVVVAESHRGTGIARLLMNYAIHEARKHGISRLFLECVPLHRPLYRKFGFIELPGTHDRVANVDKTVVAMELDLSQEPAKIGSLPALGNTIIDAQDSLCACQNRECYSGDYALYKTKTCPLYYRPGQPR